MSRVKSKSQVFAYLLTMLSIRTHILYVTWKSTSLHTKHFIFPKQRQNNCKCGYKCWWQAFKSAVLQELWMSGTLPIYEIRLGSLHVWQFPYMGRALQSQSLWEERKRDTDRDRDRERELETIIFWKGKIEFCTSGAWYQPAVLVLGP